MMYDDTIQTIEESAQNYDLNVLIPASNTIIVKEATEAPSFRLWLEALDEAEEDVSLTWSENTAEVTVTNN